MGSSKLARKMIKRVKIQMAAQEMTQIEMARRTRLAVPTVNRILKGRNDPTLDTIEKISRALGLKPIDLFD